jgi:hypothetical protein
MMRRGADMMHTRRMARHRTMAASAMAQRRRRTTSWAAPMMTWSGKPRQGNAGYQRDNQFLVHVISPLLDVQSVWSFSPGILTRPDVFSHIG